ncbi:MAG: J domain-containing protein [Elusimicrobiota bacterium]
MHKDCYVVLGVPRGAPDEEIKLAYRELALIHHPDRNPGNAAAARKFMLVKEAYETLTDPNERRLHDQELKVLDGRNRAPKAPRSAVDPSSPEPERPVQRGLSDRDVLSRSIIAVGAILAGRGFLGAYVAPHSGALERWLSLGGGQNEAFLFFLAGIALAIFGLGR